MKSSVLIASLLVASVASAAPEGYGISSWAGWKPGRVSRAECPHLRNVPLILHWKTLEPRPGEYKFEQYFGKPLKAAVADDLHAFAMIWVGPACPNWLYEMGVPKVYTDRAVNPLGQKMSKEKNRFPYYQHPEYKTRFFKLIEALGAYVRGLPPKLRQRILFVQSCEGSTGDGQPYKGEPLDEQYAISKEEWNDFRMETWKRYQKAFPEIPILINSDANMKEQSKWMLDNMDVIALKHGMFSHGYHVSDNVERLENFQWLEAEAKRRGRPVITRGEMDGEMFVYRWSKRNIPQSLYWSGLFATHCRIDVWNIPHKALADKANFATFEFFNRYAGETDPATAPFAFCALRDGLDASDFDRFPAKTYGGKPGNKRDVERYVRIAEAYASYGARMDDPEKATGGGMVNRKRNGCNDVGWGIIPGNYSRFLAQVEPGSGDVGRWNVDETIHGRFARSFEHESDKTRMRFRLNNAFAADQIAVRVTYLDQGRGAWSLGVSNSPEKKVVQNGDSGSWKTITVSMPPKRLRDAELLLNYKSGANTIFHMIEIEQREN